MNAIAPSAGVVAFLILRTEKSIKRKHRERTRKNAGGIKNGKD
jgi:hypothetical protein